MNRIIWHLTYWTAHRRAIRRRLDEVRRGA
jgi:hypothetical protein